MQIPRKPRRVLLVLHIAVSVSWLGLAVALLALGISAYASGSLEMASAAYRSMKVFGDWLLPPIALLTLASGLLLSLGSKWGLAQHRWVWIKFLLSTALATATIFALRPDINAAAAEAAAGGVTLHGDLIAAPIVSSSGYLLMTVLSVIKPWGLTKRGKRLREAEIAARRSAGAEAARLQQAG